MNASAIIVIVSGILWVMLGVANIGLLDYAHPAVANHVGEAIMFDVWWFIAPGVVLSALGWWWLKSSRAKPADTTTPQN